MHINEFDYDLPEGLIAQYPCEKREMSRLMVVDRGTGKIEHKRFYDILDYLHPGDCLVMNDSKVIPARLYGSRPSGARVELLLLRNIEGDTWQAMVRPGKKMQIGDRADFFSPGGKEMSAEVKAYGEDGTRVVTFTYEGCPQRARFFAILDRIGKMPLPPYIRRENEAEDKGRYQTVYCREEGSAAAPTAGLHFTGGLLDAARNKGVQTAFVTLHVGLGTFRPVKCSTVEEHQMHFEHCSIDAQNAAVINAAKKAGGRIVCVGTTSVRTLESAAVADQGGQIQYGKYEQTNNQSGAGGKASYYVPPGEGDTNIFIYPGYTFKMADALITNFHLPKSTLLMLISALYDKDKILEAYREAIREEYRFFSYGDAMLIV